MHLALKFHWTQKYTRPWFNFCNFLVPSLSRDHRFIIYLIREILSRKLAATQLSEITEIRADADITSWQWIVATRSSYLRTPESRAIPMSFGFEMLPTPLRANFKLLIIPIRDGFSRLAFSSTLHSSIEPWRLFTGFSATSCPLSFSPPLVRRAGVGWKPPRTTEVLIEFIAMLFMRDRERAREGTNERENGERWGKLERKGERETWEDRGGKREPYISTSRIGVAVVLVSNIPVSRVPQGHPSYPEDCRNVRAKSAARCM